VMWGRAKTVPCYQQACRQHIVAASLQINAYGSQHACWSPKAYRYHRVRWQLTASACLLHTETIALRVTNKLVSDPRLALMGINMLADTQGRALSTCLLTTHCSAILQNNRLWLSTSLLINQDSYIAAAITLMDPNMLVDHKRLIFITGLGDNSLILHACWIQKQSL
jgi:hypothetical protein